MVCSLNRIQSGFEVPVVIERHFCLVPRKMTGKAVVTDLSRAVSQGRPLKAYRVRGEVSRECARL